MEKVKSLLSSSSRSPTRNPKETTTSSKDSKTTENAKSPLSPPSVRVLVIGAGSRGTGFAQHILEQTSARVVSVAEPIESKRKYLGERYIWTDGVRQEDQEFDSWQDFVKYEETRRMRETAGEKALPGVDAVMICTLDHTHCEIIEALAPFKLHIMCEKPLGTNLKDCLRIRKALTPSDGKAPTAIFSVGHVMRYSPHNTMLRKLVLEEKVIGEVLSVEHTEPVGYWHFSHSYVRGNWRKESYTAPSLLTKSCHDIDWLMWMLSTPLDPRDAPHLPKTITSTGSLTYFRKTRKPAGAGDATNCLRCPIERECVYSAKRIYVDHVLKEKKYTGWPVKIVNPDIENCYQQKGPEAAEAMLLSSLAEDYSADTPEAEIEARPWFGRCVWDADNDVNDDQTVTVVWDDDKESGRGAKNATLHMVAWSRAICSRRGRIYGTKGEIEYDSSTIKVDNFETGDQQSHNQAEWNSGGHGGGDAGLTGQFIKAIEAVSNGTSVEEAQATYIGCTVEDAFRSHAVVFAAEDARKSGRTIDWADWWSSNTKNA